MNMNLNRIDQDEICDFARVTLTRHVNAGIEGHSNLHEAVQRDLIRDKSCTRDRAGMIAATVVADHDAKSTQSRIDLSHSTSTCLFVTVNGERRAVTVREIETLVLNDC